ncbi:hypothetical protein LCGC14_1233530 [marine sediment metagenome]|uniref:Uncharacterized protein n=1 Tax=marine sediment metagenome TaxID=412755 RepID=A0A0F9LBY3_9ZZZZ
MESWKQELDHKYEELMDTGNIHVIDEANEVILIAIEKLNTIATGEEDED